MTKAKLIVFSVFGLLLGYVINRFVYLAQIAQGTNTTKVEAAFIQLITSLQSHPFGFSTRLYPFIGFIVGLVICLLVFLLMLPDGVYMRGKEYGSARWATLKQLKPLANKIPEKNILASKEVKLNLETQGVSFLLQRNDNVMVISGAGGGKTRLYVKPNLSQFHSSYIVTDPKGTLIHETGQMMEKAGYKIKVFDINTLQNTDGFNPFAYIHDEVTLKRIIQVVIDATNSEHAKKGEPFWDKSEELLLGAIFSYLYYRYNGDGEIEGSGEMPTLYQVSDLIRLLERKNEKIPSVLEGMFDEFEADFGSDNYAMLQFNSFRVFKGDTRSSVLAIAIARFSMFDLKPIRRILKEDTLEIEKWGTEKTVVYLPIPDLDTTFNFLTTMIFILAFRTLEYQADQVYHGHLPIHVRFLLDEFANLGKIPNIKQALSVFRSREISINIILQSLNQLKALYKDDWQSFIANCDTVIYLAGPTEQDTVKFFSERSGKTTINMKKQSESRGSQGSYSINHEVLGRELITQAEVYELRRDQCLVSISSMPMYKGKKYDPKDHPRYEEWSNSPQDKNWYEYKRYLDLGEMWDDNVATESAINCVEVTEEEIEKEETIYESLT